MALCYFFPEQRHQENVRRQIQIHTLKDLKPNNNVPGRMSNLVQFNLKRKHGRSNRWLGRFQQGRRCGRKSRGGKGVAGSFTSTPASPPGSSVPRPGGDASARQPAAPAAPGPRWGPAVWATTHKHTCTKHGHCCPPARSEPTTEQLALFQGGWHRPLPRCTLRSIRKVGEPKGPLRSSNKEPAAHSCCLFGRCPLVPEPTPTP